MRCCWCLTSWPDQVKKRIFWAENVAFMKISLPWLDALILGSDYRLKHCWAGQKVASEPMSGLFFALNEGADATVLVKSDQWSRNKIILKPLVQNYLSTYHRVRHKPFIFSHRVSTRECKERGWRDLRPDFRKSSATCLFFHLTVIYLIFSVVLFQIYPQIACMRGSHW